MQSSINIFKILKQENSISPLKVLLPEQAIMFYDVAKEVWDRFFLKHRTALQATTGYRSSNSHTLLNPARPKPSTQKKKTNPFTQTAHAMDAIVKLQQRWREILYKNGVKVPLRTGKKDDPEFTFFLNNQHIKKSLNQYGLSTLAEALHSGNWYVWLVGGHDGDWNQDVFNDPELPYLAITLYQRKVITEQQFYTLMEWSNICAEFKPKGVYAILDENLQFTSAAIKYLFPYLKLSIYTDLAEKQKESLRNLIATLPRSEQILYLTEPGKYATPESISSLEKALMSIGKIRLDETSQNLIHFSVGVKDAIGIVQYGLDNYVRPNNRLAKLDISDIETSVNMEQRPVSTNYPGVKAYDKIHGVQDPSIVFAIAHDEAHADTMSHIPLNMRGAIKRFALVTRKTAGFERSKEIWTWIDCEFHRFISAALPSEEHLIAKYGTPREKMDLFCKLLQDGTFTDPNSSYAYLINTEKLLSTAGIMIFHDFFVNRSEWLKLGIEPELFTGELATHYEKIKKLYHVFPELKALDSKSFTALMSIIQNLKPLTSRNLLEEAQQLQALVTLFTDHVQELDGFITFDKVKKDINPYNEIKNMLSINIAGVNCRDDNLCKFLITALNDGKTIAYFKAAFNDPTSMESFHNEEYKIAEVFKVSLEKIWSLPTTIRQEFKDHIAVLTRWSFHEVPLDKFIQLKPELRTLIYKDYYLLAQGVIQFLNKGIDPGIINSINHELLAILSFRDHITLQLVKQDKLDLSRVNEVSPAQLTIIIDEFEKELLEKERYENPNLYSFN